MSTVVLTWNFNDFIRILQIKQLDLSIKLKAWRLSDVKSGPIDHFIICGTAVVDVRLVIGFTKLSSSACRN